MASLEVLQSDRVVDRFELPVGDEPSESVRYLEVAESNGMPKLREVEAADAELVLARTERHWVLLLPPGMTSVRIGRIPILGMKLLDHGDVLAMKGLQLAFQGERTELLSADAELIRQSRSCPVCREDFKEGDRVVYCPVCNLAHHYADAEGHEDCWNYNGRCASRPFCGHILKTAPKASPAA